MAWLDKEVIPQIRDEKELWAVCPKCHAHFPRAEYPKGLAECPSCGASFNAYKHKNCPACGNTYKMEDADWVIDSIK